MADHLRIRLTEIRQLREGDIVCHRVTGKRWLIATVKGDHATGVDTCDITNPDEWDLVGRARAILTGD